MSNLIDIEHLVTFSYAARYLHVSRPTVYAYVERDRLHPVSIGANRYIHLLELQALAAQLAQKNNGK